MSVNSFHLCVFFIYCITLLRCHITKNMTVLMFFPNKGWLDIIHPSWILHRHFTGSSHYRNLEAFELSSKRIASFSYSPFPNSAHLSQSLGYWVTFARALTWFDPRSNRQRGDSALFLRFISSRRFSAEWKSAASLQCNVARYGDRTESIPVVSIRYRPRKHASLKRWSVL